MAVQLKVNTVDRSSWIDWRSINLTLVLTKEVSTLTFDVLKKTGVTIPVVGDQIDLYDTSVHIFGGTVTESQLRIDGGIQARYRITVTDWSYQFDARNVVQTYTDMDPGAIVQDIIANFTTGFTDTNVQLAGYTIPSVKFNYQPPTKCIQKIAQLIGWEWYIDPDKDVHFFLGSSIDTPAPFNLDDTSGNHEWPTVDYAVNTQNLKNSVYVIGSTYKKTYDATTAIDLYITVSGQKTYPLVYPYDPATLTVTVDGVSKTVGTYGKDDPGSFDVLYSNATGTPPFIVFSSDPGAAHTLKIFGDAQVPILGYSNDADSIAAYGEFQDTIVDKQITTYQEAQQRALAEVLQYGNPIDDLKFKTLQTGLMIGQTITLNSTILGVNVTLTIKRIQAKGYSPSQLEYEVEAIGGDKVRFTDIMAVLLEQELNQNSVDDTTVLQVLVRIGETLITADSVSAASNGSSPYLWMANDELHYSSELETTLTADSFGISNAAQSLAGVTSVISKLSGTDTLGFGLSTGYQKIAQSFVATENMTTITQVLQRLANTGTPTGTITWAIQADSGGSPSGANLATNAPAFSSMPIGSDFNGGGIRLALTNGTTYWLVLTDSTLDDANYYNIAYDSAGNYGTLKRYDGAAWQTVAGTLRFAIQKSSEIALTSTISLAYNAGALFWRMKTSNSSYQNIFANGRLAGSGQIEIFDSTHLRFESKTNNAYTNTAITCGKNICDGEWHSFCLVFGASNMQLYVDGALAWSKGSALTEDTVNQTYAYIGAEQQRLNATYGDALAADIANVTDISFEPDATAVSEMHRGTRWGFSAWS